ncbi:MAG: hypothetical protein JW715_07845 [Sedimentisphaerales bacterium]|nr:hypothetical protein [Sedimentisphaerales bacterium]
MRNSKKIILITILICVVFEHICLAWIIQSKEEENRLKALELLDKYIATQDKLRTSFISKSEIISKFQVLNRLRPQYKKGTLYEVNRKREIRSDGNRHYSFVKRWGDNAGREPTTEEHSNYNYNLWDGIYRYQYLYSPDRPATSSRKNGMLFLTRKDNITLPQERIRDSETVGFFLGSSERIDAELRRADSLTVRPETEEINGSKCFVIDAKAKGCEYSIWIDPEHDYNISKAIIKRGWTTAGDPKDYNNPPKGNTEVDLTNVSFKKIDDVWLTAEYDYGYNIKYADGGYEISNEHYKIVEFLRNPDHDALGSFEPNFIRNGALVDIIGFLPGIRFTWQEGKIIDSDGIEVDLKTLKPPSLMRKALPSLAEFNVRLNPELIKDKMVLVCFWDMNQRPSRDYIQTLNKRAQELLDRDVYMVFVQAEQIDQKKLIAWLKENRIEPPVGISRSRLLILKQSWGVKSLPWLILTDAGHVVSNEGFGLDELDKKISILRNTTTKDEKEAENTGR